MSGQKLKTGTNDALLAFAAGTLCPIAPFLVFLKANYYNPVATEVWPLYGLALLSGAIVGSLALLQNKKPALVALWAVVSGSILLSLHDASIIFMLAIVIACASLIALLRGGATTIVTIAAVVHISTTLVLVEPGSPLQQQAAKPASAARADVPPVLHIVMDEMSGIHGLPAEVGGTVRVRDRIANVLVANGFRVYSKSYSEYVGTSDSLSNLFNFDSSSVQRTYFSQFGERPSLTSNQYFEHLVGLGYEIHVYQSSHLDFCGSSENLVTSCTVYRSNSIGALQDVPIPSWEKTTFVLRSFLASARVWRGLRRAYNRVVSAWDLDIPVWGVSNNRTGPLTVLPVTEILRQRASTIESGQVVFAHLLLTHYPYVLDANCSIKEQPDMWLYRAPRAVLGTLAQQNDQPSRQLRYEHYLAQYECSLQIIDQILQEMAQNTEWNRAIVIIHSDHGSRIVRRFPGHDIEASDSDYRDIYSTFFAVRNGASTGEILTTLMPISAILANAWNIDPPDNSAHRVYAAELGPADLEAIPLRGFDTDP